MSRRNKAAEATEDTAATEEPPAPEVPTKPSGFYVAPGKSLTTLAGVKGPDELVEERHVSGGREQLMGLAQKGYLVIR